MVVSCSSETKAPTVDPFSTSAREGFVRGCVDHGQRSVGEELAQSLCSCVVDHFAKALDAESYRSLSNDLSKGVLSEEAVQAFARCFGKEADVANGYPSQVRAVLSNHCMTILSSRAGESEDKAMQEQRKARDTADCECAVKHVEQTVPVDRLIGSLGPNAEPVALFDGVLAACRGEAKNASTE
tara:strand:+ start:2323 stop:2874 length:552 start_codon:yes stop_codon:yes gene_type:complete